MKTFTIIEFFKRKVSNDLKINISGIILPTINIEENLDISTKKNLNEPVEENLDVSIVENLDILIEENSTLLTPSPNSILENNHN